MNVKQLQDVLESVAELHESDGAGEKAAALRAFKKALNPLRAGSVSELLTVLERVESLEKAPGSGRIRSNESE